MSKKMATIRRGVTTDPDGTRWWVIELSPSHPELGSHLRYCRKWTKYGEGTRYVPCDSRGRDRAADVWEMKGKQPPAAMAIIGYEVVPAQ